MYEINLLILRKLFENSRLTYRELAEITDMSVSAIHKRIRNLEDDRIINAFIARPSVFELKSLWIMTFGTSKANSMKHLVRSLNNMRVSNLLP